MTILIMHAHLTYEFKFSKAILNSLVYTKTVRFLNNHITRLIHSRGQVIDEYCCTWFMNSNFSLHKAGRYWTRSCIERKVCSSITILLDGFAVMCSEKPDIHTYSTNPRCICFIYQPTLRCICINIHLAAPSICHVTIVYIHTRICIS